MTTAIRNLLTILLFIATIGMFGWTFLRHHDMVRENKPPHDHPFLRQSTNDVVAYHLETSQGQKSYTGAHLETLKKLPVKVVIWLETRPRLDGTLVAADQESEAGEAPLLKNVLEELLRTPNRRLILNLRGNRAGVHQAVAKAVEEAQAGDRVLIQSPEDGFLKDVREAKPAWLFGTSLAQVTQTILFSSMGLVALAKIRGDVLVIEAPPKEHLLERLTDDIIAEAHRRQLKIFAGPVSSKEEAIRLWNRGFDSILTPNPEAILGALPSHR